MGLKKGEVANPKGVNGTTKAQKQIKELLMHLSPKAVKKLEQMLDDPDHMQFATKEILDRVWGKPAQAVEVSGKDGKDLTVNINLTPNDND